VSSTLFIDITPVECQHGSKEYAYPRDSTQSLLASFVPVQGYSHAVIYSSVGFIDTDIYGAIKILQSIISDISQRISAQSIEERDAI